MGWRDDTWGDRTLRRKVRLRDEAIPVDGGRLFPLYHATAWSREVLAEGFRLDRKKGGLGGSSTSYAVSFTQDLDFACTIALCLVDAAGIARGRITALNVLNRAYVEGGDVLLNKTLYWTSIEAGAWLTREIRSLAGARDVDGLERLLSGLSGDAARDAAWGVYKTYLRARCDLELDYDPGFFGTHWRAFVDVDAQNVGVLVCVARDVVWVRDNWRCRDTPGGFTYSGWGRPPFFPDQDEYRVCDVSKIDVLGLVPRERCGL